MAKGERDWAQLDAFEAEYTERLAAEKKRGDQGSQFLGYLAGLASGREDFWSDEVKPQDPESGRLFALRAKILGLREKVGAPPTPEGALLEVEKPFVPSLLPRSREKQRARIRFFSDPAPPGFLYPVHYDEIRQTLAELPSEHTATVREIRLSNQRRTGTDGDWLDGEIRLHCLIREDGQRVLGRTETTQDVERFGGKLEWEGNKLVAVWPLEAYKTFVLRRVLIHEVAHGVAELPGYADAVRRAGSVERFCERYAENFYKPPGPSVRLGF